MKRFNFRLSHLIANLCSAMLALLGFGCSSEPDDILCMYGSPTGDFEIKGAVTDEDSNEISDAEIRVAPSQTPSGLYSIQTASTDASGQYVAHGDSFGMGELKVVCVPADPDLEPDSVIVKLNYNKDGGGAWYAGEAKETVNFHLKPKPSEQE